MTQRLLDVVDLGLRSYEETLELQRELRLARLAGTLSHDTLILVEHPPVYTMGRGTRLSSLPIAPAALRALGADVVEIERGGDVTWHGPGQLVGYPIINLSAHREDLHWYLRALEQVLIDALGLLGIPAERLAGKTGVWTRGRKIASIGIHVKQWVTLHGFALNIDPDLSWFDAIIPCGIDGVEMTSVRRELGEESDAMLSSRVRSTVVSTFGKTFSLTPHLLAQEAIPGRLATNTGSGRP